MQITTGTIGCKEACLSLAAFWVAALFDFLESQLNTEKLDVQVRLAECEPVDESTMRRQMSTCFQRLKAHLSPAFKSEGSLIGIFRMFNTVTRLSFAVETTTGYYAFFWESETGATSE